MARPCLLNHIKNVSHSWKVLVLALLMCASLTGIFCFGSLLSSTITDCISNEFANEVKNNTNGGSYLPLVVEHKKNENFFSPYSEFHATYASFSHSQMYFAGTVNADKTNDIRIKEISGCENLSFLYANVFSNVAYKGHYKHEFYPIELMFRGENSSGGHYSFCYISKTHADALLNLRGLLANSQNYRSLLKTTITISINGDDYDFSIGNIYYETNYYFEGLKETMGDFLLGYTRYPEQLKKQACYFMGRHEFQNKYFMNRISSLYSKEACDLKISPYSLKDSLTESRKDELLGFYYYRSDSLANVLGVALIVLCACLYAASLLIAYFAGVIDDVLTGFLLFIASSLPYLTFLIVFLVTNSSLFISSISLLVNGVLVTVFLFVVGGVILHRKRLRFMEEKHD